MSALRGCLSGSGARRRVAFVIALGLIFWTAQRPVVAAGPQIFTANLTGAQQVPVVSSSGTGAGTVLLNAAEDQIIVNLTFSGLTSAATAAHIHGAAAAGSNAGVLFDFSGVTPAFTSGTIQQQTFPITPAQVAELKAGLYYFNIHTATSGNGEIRGQIGLAAVQFTTTLSGAQQAPPVSSSGTGTGTVALNAAETQLFVHMSFSGLSSNATAAHIHGPAAAGVNTGVLFDFASVVPAATSGSIPQQTFPISAAQVVELKNGLYYFNIHTVNNGGGEIRGQIAFPAITTQPANRTVAAGQNATFTVAASGAPAPAFQWQESYSGLPFTNLTNGGAYSGVTTATLTIVASSGLNGYQYRAVATNSLGSETSTAATLTVTVAPAIAAQPANQTVTAGATATFTAAATGNPAPTVQWQVSTNGGSTFADVSGATATTLSFTAAAADTGKQFRAVFTNSVGTATTSAATLTVNAAPTIATQPTNQTVAPGDTATFTAAATGNPAPTVQWQVSTNGGSTFADVSGATATTHTFTAAQADTGKQFRAVFTNSVGTATTSAATLTVNAGPTIATQPANQTVTAGATATFTAAATGNPAPTVQWQASTNGGSTFADVSGATATTHAFTAAAADSGKQFRAVFTNSVGTATTSAATLTVNAGPTIATQPTNQTVAPGGTATFTAAATGNPAPTVQWQVSTNGGSTFADVSGATVTTHAFTAAAADSGKQFRAVFTNSAGTATSSAATLTVTLPTMALDKTSLVFSAVTTGSAFSSQTSAQTVRLTQTGPGTVTWTAASTTPWLVVTPSSGSGSATLTISTPFAAGLAATQTGPVTLTFSGASNTAGPINVTLNATSTGSAPVGAFDTPTDGTTGVTGSIAVTGWAMDDIEVTGVRILRDPLAGEPAGALVLLGNAVLVDGARSDVQALFPSSPRNSRAGWGYLMLTNFLPGLGNGTFRLTAIADDADGHSTILGTKTITCTNSSATTPTGAIDTPVQGGTVSGNVTNFGWVLSRNPYRADPPGGGAVRIVIDGGFVSQVPSGWTSRPDLTALFPASEYPGIGTALGVAGFDSTALANGVHTISWLVTDNIGSASGIGSRYFTVSNGSLVLDDSFRLPSTGLRPGKAAATLSIAQTSGNVALSDLSWLPPSAGSITGRRGFNMDTPLQAYPVRNGVATIQSEELDRIELQLAGVERSTDKVDGTFTGYLRVAGGLAPLPIGSALNASTGEFTWAPGVGFVGPYDLVFARWENGRAVSRQDVRVVLNAKGSNRVGPQVAIDTPASRADVAQPFVVAGWALHKGDANDPAGTGVDTLHVWAYPLTGGHPIFVGAAAYGGARPDVAALFGERFGPSGFGLTVDGLPPGTYDLAVFAWSTVDNRFLPAKVVRVTVR